MNLQQFRKALKFLDRSRIREVRILGGEPTLHPAFKEMIRMAHGKGRKVLLFTNGIFSADILKFLVGFPADGMRVMVNVTPGKTVNNRETQQQEITLRELGTRAMPGITIYHPDIDLEFLPELIERTRIHKTIRVGLAMPRAGSKNVWLHPELYRSVASRIMDLAEKSAQRGIRLGFDCGFVPCMFERLQLNALKTYKADFGWRCNPILDIDARGMVYPCFPLADFFSQKLNGKAAALIRAQFVSQTKELGKPGIFQECKDCEFMKKGSCTGGCIAVAIDSTHFNQFQNTDDLVSKETGGGI